MVKSVRRNCLANKGKRITGSPKTQITIMHFPHAHSALQASEKYSLHFANNLDWPGNRNSQIILPFLLEKLACVGCSELLAPPELQTCTTMLRQLLRFLCHGEVGTFQPSNRWYSAEGGAMERVIHEQVYLGPKIMNHLVRQIFEFVLRASTGHWGSWVVNRLKN